MNQAKIKPKITRANGSNFMCVGRINIDWLIGDSHDINLPKQIDKVESINIGLIMFVYSLILIYEALSCDLHIVTILNRTE